MGNESEAVPVKSGENGEAKGRTVAARDPWSALRGEIDEVFDRFTAGWPRMLGHFELGWVPHRKITVH